MTTPQTVTFSSLVCSAIIIILLISGALLGAKPHGRLRRYFLIVSGCLLITCLLEMPMLLLMGAEDAALTLLRRWLFFLDYAVAAVGRTAYCFYVCELISLKASVSKRPIQVVFCLEAVHVLLEAAGGLNLIPPWLIYLNRDMILPALSIAVSTFIALRHSKALKRRELVSLILYVILPLLGYLAEYLFTGIWLACFAGAVTLLLIYINIQAELGQRVFEQERELSESRTAIMLSQIQPHFIMNVLLAIESLCQEEGAVRSENAMRTLTDYLGGNLKSAMEKEPVEFAKELEHTKLYLTIARLCFEDKLRVVYDIDSEASGFRLPALTLQPIVENAVWHGICSLTDGGTVTIRTEKAPDSYRVIIADDGAGFDPDAPKRDGRPHIGIENVRYRMETICGGGLVIDSAPGAGTSAVLIIPREDADNESDSR